jgi:hypothetical protein
MFVRVHLWLNFLRFLYLSGPEKINNLFFSENGLERLGTLWKGLERPNDNLGKVWERSLEGLGNILRVPWKAL